MLVLVLVVSEFDCVLASRTSYETGVRERHMTRHENIERRDVQCAQNRSDDV